MQVPVSKSASAGNCEEEYDLWQARKDVERLIHDYTSRNERAPFELNRLRAFLDHLWQPGQPVRP